MSEIIGLMILTGGAPVEQVAYSTLHRERGLLPCLTRASCLIFFLGKAAIMTLFIVMLGFKANVMNIV